MLGSSIIADRSGFKVKVGYGSPEDEQEIVRRMVNDVEISLEKVFNHDDLGRLAKLAEKIHVSEKVLTSIDWLLKLLI